MAKPKIPPMVSPALKRGDLVFALRDLPSISDSVIRFSKGVVFEEANAYGDGFGPMVRFESGACGNVYAGDVQEQSEYQREQKLEDARFELKYAKEALAGLESAPKRIPAARRRVRTALAVMAKLKR